MTKQKDEGEHKVAYLRVGDVVMNDWNGDRKPDKEFIASVKEKGVLQPILVRPSESGAYQVVCGSRRLQAAVTCNLERIPAVVREMTDEDARECTLVENIQRQSLTPLEEADAVATMLRVKDADAVAGSIGRTKRYVAECRRIAEALTPGAKKALTRKGFPVVPRESLALLASLPQKEQLRFIENVEDHGAHLLADVDWVRSSIFEEMAPLGDDCPFDQASDSLDPKAGPCTICPKRTGSDPDLFGGVFAKADKCGDPACYQRKLYANTKAAIEAAVQKNPNAKKGFLDTRLTSEAKAELAEEADEIQEYSWGRGLSICKKKDEGAVQYVLIYPLEKAGQVVYARTASAKNKAAAAASGEKPDSGRMKGPELLKRRRLAWMMKSLSDSLYKSKGLATAFDADDKMLELVAKYGSPAVVAHGGKKKESVRFAVFFAMVGGIIRQELTFRLVSEIVPKEAEASIRRVLSYVDDKFEDTYDALSTKAAEEIGGGRKKKADKPEPEEPGDETDEDEVEDEEEGDEE